MKRVIAIALTALCGGALGAALTSGAAVASSTVPFAVDFGIVTPGAEREAHTEVDVAAMSTVTAAGWDQTTGSGVWGASLCVTTDACTSVDDLVGTRIAAGTYDLVVRLAMPTRSDGSPTSAHGHLVLTETSASADGLATTGGTPPWIAAAIGAVALGIGAALKVRRRRDREEVAS